MPDPSYKSETAAMHSKAKELRAKVTAEAKKKNVSVSKTALDNFVDTYKKTKVGPIQRAIGRFIDSFNTKYPKLTIEPQANRAKSQGGRTAKQARAVKVKAATKVSPIKTLPKSKPKAPVKKKPMATPKSKPKMYTAINTKTGKADFDAPKVTAAQRMKQEDKYKALSRVNKAAKSSMAKKGKK